MFLWNIENEKSETLRFIKTTAELDERKLINESRQKIWKLLDFVAKQVKQNLDYRTKDYSALHYNLDDVNRYMFVSQD